MGKISPQSVYLPSEVLTALRAYRAAGHKINLSRLVSQVLVDRFISIEKGRRLTGDPFLYTPIQLADMKIKLEDDG
jgi:hypothetical protein